MATRISTKVLDEARALVQVLPEMDGKMPAELKSAVVKAAVTAAEAAENALVVAKKTHATAVDQAQDALAKVRDLLVRVRATVKGAYGPDSLEVQKVGIKRQSDHRRPTRKTPA